MATIQETLTAMNSKLGSKFDKLAKECSEMGNRAAYERYMPARPARISESDWANFMMHRMDVVSGFVKAW